MLHLIHTILDWIYPPRCMSCRNPLPLQDKPGRSLWLCSYCKNLFQPLDVPGCGICSTPVDAGVTVCASCNGKGFSFVHNRSAFAYEDLVRDLIHDIKFRRRRHVAQGLGRLWASGFLGPFLDSINSVNSIKTAAILVPLPMHKAKRRQRGFDQAQILASSIGEVTGIKAISILERTQDTPPQSGLHPRQRIENVKGAFRIKPEFTGKIAGQTIVLVDDIYTTGASLDECARVLKSGGASDVYAMTLAIAVRKGGQSRNIDDFSM